MEKKLNKCFAVRVCALMSALVILLCCTVPASAAGGTWGVPVSFDSIGLSGTASTSIIGYAPFPLSSSGPSSTAIGGIDISSSFSNLEDGMVDIDYTFSSGSYVVTLRADQLVIPSSFFFTNAGYLIFRFYNGSDVLTTRAVLSYNLAKVYSGSNYKLQYQGDSMTIESVNGLDLSTVIGNRLEIAGNSQDELGDYVLLDDFYLSFSSDTPITKFNMRQNSQSTRYTFRNWFDSQDLSGKTVVVDPSNPSGVDLVSWLSVAVGGFLDFQLWPGMSLNELMWIILVIGVLFWFLKLTI